MIEIKIQKALKAASGEMNLDLDLAIEQGQFISLYGDSGVGKTSTLRILAGLLQPDAGHIKVDGTTWFDHQSKTNLAPQKRSIGMVFQDYALFPNMSVVQNLQFALGKNKQDGIVHRLVEVMELHGLKDQMPNTLSGGQQQRVALARAVVQQPKILLLDEPLSALDTKLRLKLQDYLAQIHREFNLTTLLISHDKGEIIKLSDRVFVLDNGKIVNQGTPEEVFINNRALSGKFKFTGQVLKIEKQEVVHIVTVMIHNNIVKVVAQDSEIQDLNIGDEVMVASKAFNPIIYKI